jgi:xanthine dehydrogenase small subunit
MAVSFVINGAQVAVNDADPHVTLLQWLRASGRTGSKEGCAEGECGACAVAVVSADARGRTRFEPVNSCLVPLPAVHGQSIFTVEGLADQDGALHPVQAAMVAQGGSQCGYCTPGFVVSLFCEYYRPGREGYDPEAIAGNLCRCTGYRPIADVARSLPQPDANDPRLALLRAPVFAKTAISHASVAARYVRPTELAGVFEALREDPHGMLIAGGTDLMVYANQRYERFSTLIALDALDELRRFEIEDHEIVLGAGLPLSAIEERLSHDYRGVIPVLEQVLPLFSSRLIRNRATLGGSLGTASPIGDIAPALLALDADVTLGAASGTRRLPLRDFFLGYRKSVLTAGELIVSVHLKRPLAAHQRFYKVSKRMLDDISTVAAAFALDLDASGRVERLSVAYGGIAATPIRALDVERLARGKPWSRTTLAGLLAQAETVGTPQADQRGSAAYRRAMTGRLLEKFFVETAGAEA